MRSFLFMSDPSTHREETPSVFANGQKTDSGANNSESQLERRAFITTRSRANSSVSRVGVDYFDPVGVKELRRVLTEPSGHDSVTQRFFHKVPYHHGQEKRDPPSSVSSTTLTGLRVDDGVDLEKTLRLIVGK